MNGIYTRAAGFIALVLIAGAILSGGIGAAAVKRPEPPVITPDGGSYGLNAVVRVSIRGEPGTRIVYTLDGSIPEEHRGIRTDSNLIFFDLPPGDVTVNAVAVAPGRGKSMARRAVFVRAGSR
jgi:hypothetical protein